MGLMHTPRLCIDGRAALEFRSRGLLAQEVIDQLVSANGEEPASSEWIEKHRTVLLSHPEQVFSGQLKRHDTRLRIRPTPLHWLWERQFARKANLSAFHRFRPADRVGAALPCQTITTLLPPSLSLPRFLPRGAGRTYVVPSRADASLLESRYSVSLENVRIVRPGVRRYSHYAASPKCRADGYVLFLMGSRVKPRPAAGILPLLQDRIRPYPHKIVSLGNRSDFTPDSWLKLIKNARICFYLTASPFDWPVLALETLFWGIPTVFMDENSALSEVLPHSPLKLSRVLVDSPDVPALDRFAEEAKKSLTEKGIFEPLFLARQYKEIYEELSRTTS